MEKDFAKLALEYLDSLYGYAWILTRNQTEAEDLVQETYLRAVRAFGGLVHDSNLKAWLFAIMRNIWINQRRRTSSGPQFVKLEQGQFEANDCDPYRLLVQKIEREHLLAAIERLSEHHREVVLLRDIEGFSYQQIANLLGCPIGTVMSRLGRAREQLRAMLYYLYSETH
ncbi:MAG: sigma-70 family RNA polymerase sigma factor [Acidobacteriota bacterium]|nr:sigma-70 family RNA polymerase sigma factor [Blastocatellia bacterium]MDW8412061.1 sigma-70 family RNA polymerase sigma factor [Acidobacteriota bacterium]